MANRAATPDTTSRVVLLDHDPDLAGNLDLEELAQARQHAIVSAVRVPRGQWQPGEISADWVGGIGLFVLDGLLVRRVTVAQRAACELFGPGDVLRPWDADGEYEPLAISLEWRVLEDSRLAILNGGFAVRMARWPSINAQLIARVARRARHLALIQAVTHEPRTHARLLVLFWLLAERWGTVTRDGIRVALPMTHELLAMLIGVRRPSASVALKRLEAAELLVRERRDCWLITNRGVEAIRDSANPDWALVGSAPIASGGGESPACVPAQADDQR